MTAQSWHRLGQLRDSAFDLSKWIYSSFPLQHWPSSCSLTSQSDPELQLEHHCKQAIAKMPVTSFALKEKYKYQNGFDAYLE